MWCNRFSLEYFQTSESDSTFGYLSLRRIQKSQFSRTFDETDMILWAVGWYGGRCEICPRLPACLHNDRRFLILTNIVVIWSWKSSYGDIVVWYLMMLKRLGCFQLDIFWAAITTPPPPNTPERSDELFRGKKFRKTANFTIWRHFLLRSQAF